jgi:hypothetical protein
MKRVFVIGTVHADSGLATASALLAILERIKPEVIFLEMPPAALDDHFNGTRSNLESVAVSRYRGDQRVDLVPVDLPTPNAAFFADSEELHRRVERTSLEYRRLVDLNSHATREGGFAYLNSDLCIESLAAIDAEVLDTVEYIRNAQLRELHDRSRAAHEDRDTEMMKNIEDYCVRNVFAEGVFLVGAAHRGSLIDKARARGGVTSSGIEWAFGGFPGGEI